MEQPPNNHLRVGDWCVDAAAGLISRNGDSARLEARTLRLLLYLAERPGAVVSIDELLNHVWAGVIVTPDSVYQAIASLRRLLGDDPKQPSYIATVPRLGYRLVAAVAPWQKSLSPYPPAEEATPAPPSSTLPVLPRNRWRIAAAASIVFILLLGGLAAFLVHKRTSRSHRPPAAAEAAVNSIAVLPFLDLTPGMHEEEFADGITEELIDKLSRIPGLRVPSATASFYYKGKQPQVTDVARALGVTYVLDGSVRKSGVWIRVDARLVRAGNGYVVWSQTYDQPVKNMLMIQDDIASAVASSLRGLPTSSQPAE